MTESGAAIQIPAESDAAGSRRAKAAPRKFAAVSWLTRIQHFQQGAPLAYITILILQMAKIWNIWQYRDMTTGDTAHYFLDAWNWYTNFRVDIAWSPLYTAFYGSLLWLTRDTYVVTILHRVLIVLAATTLVLAVMRRLLPPSLAWLAAAWWAILPINFETLYEVHLFSYLPIFMAWLIALRRTPGPWTRAIVLGIFLVTTVYVRNEFIITTLFFGCVCAVIEIRRFRKIPVAQRPVSIFQICMSLVWVPLLMIGWSVWSTDFQYAMGLSIFTAIVGGGCLALELRFRREQSAAHGSIFVGSVYFSLIFAALLAIYGCYSISDKKYPELSGVLRDKHTLNMAQVYAFGYQQRHPEWIKNPWLDYAELTEPAFGVKWPSLLQMAIRNPKALARHVLWNISLVPSGWQILMFDEAYGKVDPDYANHFMGRSWALIDSVIVLVVVLAAVVIWWFERNEWRSWFATRSLGWWAMLAVIAVSPAVVITQRPRPSYFFGVGVFTLAITGTAVWILLRRFHLSKFECIPMLPVMLGGWLFASSQYQPAIVPPQRPLHDLYERLLPYEHEMTRNDVTFLIGDFNSEIECYVGKQDGHSFSYGTMFPEWKGQSSLVDFFHSKQINMVYLNDWAIRMIRCFSGTALQEFIDQGGKQGWHLIGSGKEPERWMLFEQTTQVTSGQTAIAEYP